MHAAPAENLCENVARGGDSLSGRASDTDSEGLLHRTLSYLSAGRSTAPQRSAGLKSKSVFPSETPPPNKPLVFSGSREYTPISAVCSFQLRTRRSAPACCSGGLPLELSAFIRPGDLRLLAGKRFQPRGILAVLISGDWVETASSPCLRS